MNRWMVKLIRWRLFALHKKTFTNRNVDCTSVLCIYLETKQQFSSKRTQFCEWRRKEPSTIALCRYSWCFQKGSQLYKMERSCIRVHQSYHIMSARTTYFQEKSIQNGFCVTIKESFCRWKRCHNDNLLYRGIYLIILENKVSVWFSYQTPGKTEEVLQ